MRSLGVPPAQKSLCRCGFRDSARGKRCKAQSPPTAATCKCPQLPLGCSIGGEDSRRQGQHLGMIEAAGGGWRRWGRMAEAEAAVGGGDYGSISPFSVSV